MNTSVSLSEVHRTVPVNQSPNPLKRLLAFLGPAYLVSVGYMDPGNWATDIQGGAQFGYSLLWVLLMSNLMAVLLQTLSARLGIVTGRDLAQACRDNYPRPLAIVLWLLCEIAIAACDLAELLGTAIGLNLLFGIPLIWGVLITAFDTIILLTIQNLGMRKFEAFIITLVFTIGLCFVIELFLAGPSIPGIIGGFSPKLPEGALLVAIGIIGATVMPHNLYLHSALVQTRAFDTSTEGKKKACKYNFIDSVIALNGAFFVNAAILIMAAAVFYENGKMVAEIEEAHALLTPLLGTTIAGTAFALALLAAGQSSTLTGTLAGQIVMEGFLNFKMRPVLRRILTRMIAIVPAVITLLQTGEKGTMDLLIISQVILSLQLPFAIIPLIHFTSNPKSMGTFANKMWVKILAWISATIIVGLNINLVIETVSDWIVNASNPMIMSLVTIPLATALGLLLLYVTFQPFVKSRHTVKHPSWQSVMDKVRSSITDASAPQYSTIAAAIAHDDTDVSVLNNAVALARKHNAALVLLHVVEGAVGTVYGQSTYDAETRSDEEYLTAVCNELQQFSIPVSVHLGYGNVPKEIVRMVNELHCDLLIMGGHGHKGIKDLIFGATISPVRHEVTIPVLIVQ